MKQLVNKETRELLKSIGLYKVSDQIYFVKVKDNWDLANLFMRCQVFYECPNPKIRNHVFTIEEYKEWYTKDFKKNDIFTYGNDWKGFNIPSEKIEECHKDIHSGKKKELCVA